MIVCSFPRTILAIIVSFLVFWVPAEALSQNWVISGTVLDSAGGPIPGTDLDLIDPNFPAVEIPVSGDSTGVDGAFNLTILTTIPAGTYCLEFNPPPGYVSSIVEIDLDGDLDLGGVNLGSGWILTGIVQDTLGNPLSPIDIDIRGSNSGWLDLTGDFTEADGTFSLTIPALVDEYRFIYRMTSPLPTAFPLQVDDLFLFADTDLGTIVMDRAHTLTGIVVDEIGDPLAGIDMNIYDSFGVAVDLNNDDTNSTGNFSVLVPEGTWDIVHRQVSASPTIERVPHAFPEFTVNENLDLGTVVLPPGVHVTGLILGSSGEVIGDANLDAEDAITGAVIHLNNDSSSLTGTFDILLPEGTMNIEVDPPTTGPTRKPTSIQAVITQPGPIDVGTIILPDAVLISGRCIDSTSTPVPNIDVELFISATGDPYPTIHENGDAQGNFAAAVESNTYDLVLFPTLASNLAPELIPQIQAITDINLGDIVLNPAVTLSGTVSVTGIPVPGATIQIQDVTTGTIPFWGTTTTDASGFYSLSFAPGSWNLIFTAPQGSGLPDHTENNLEVTQDLNFDIDLLPQPESVVDLTCTLNGSEVNLSWVNAETYSSISVLRNGTLIASLSGTETTFNDSPGAGIHQWSVIAILDTIESLETNCSVSIPPEPPTSLSCSVTGSQITLQWTNPGTYDQIFVLRDSLQIAELDGSSSTFLDTPGPGIFLYEIISSIGGVQSTPTSCSATVLPQAITDLTCQHDGLVVSLSWLEGQGHDAVEINRDGTLLATLVPGIGFFEDSGANPGIRNYSVKTTSGSLSSREVSCDVNLPPGSVTALTCQSTAPETAQLNWSSPAGATTVRIERNGVLVIELPATSTLFEENPVPSGNQLYSLTPAVGAIDGPTSSCTVDVQAPIAPPVASFNASVTTGEAPLVVDFSDTSTGDINTWLWDFDDGTTSPEQNPEHTFSSPGDYLVSLSVEGTAGVDSATLQISVLPAAVQFLRADCNNSGGMNIADAIAILNYLFGYMPNLTCLDACDSNDDENINIADAIFVLASLFSGGALPPTPFPTCGEDPAGDVLDCLSYGATCP